MANLRQKLYAWRDEEASKRAVELFRILPNTALDEIVRAMPRTKAELTAIKGIKDAKFANFGQAILAMVDEASAPAIATNDDPFGEPQEPGAVRKEEGTVFSVSAYLDILNNALWRLSARVQGEVTSIKFQGSAVYIGIKDAKDESIMNVFMWTSDYTLCGIDITEGMEVIIEGKSEIYKPTGRLSFRAQTIELVGEGALKKAYDELKKKLTLEGIFAEEKKRELPQFPEHIGLVTSKTGAVIHDFLNNLGKFGFKVRLTDVRVEGAMASREILGALRYWKTQPINVLVVIRGGGSLESLLAFNNELVVKAIAEFPVPVICAIGHDKDVPLAQLASDLAPSTPTAATVLLNHSWERAASDILLSERILLDGLSRSFTRSGLLLSESQSQLMQRFTHLRAKVTDAAQAVRACLPILSGAFLRAKKDADELIRVTALAYTNSLTEMTETLRMIATELEARNPLRQLKLGYSILSQDGKILRRVENAKKGEHFEAKLADGTIEATITAVTKGTLD